MKSWVWLVTAPWEENSAGENIMKKQFAWRSVREEEHGKETEVKGDVNGDGGKVNQRCWKREPGYCKERERGMGNACGRERIEREGRGREGGERKGRETKERPQIQSPNHPVGVLQRRSCPALEEAPHSFQWKMVVVGASIMSPSQGAV